MVEREVLGFCRCSGKWKVVYVAVDSLILCFGCRYFRVKTVRRSR